MNEQSSTFHSGGLRIENWNGEFCELLEKWSVVSGQWLAQVNCWRITRKVVSGQWLAQVDWGRITRKLRKPIRKIRR